jgi:hypothetical protein
MTIKVSADPFGNIMSLPVHEIYSTDQDYLLVPDLSSEPKENMQSFATRPSLAYGIYKRPVDYLKQICLEYINAVSKHSIGDADDIIGDTTGIIWKVLGATHRFANANPVEKEASTDLLHSLTVVSTLAWELLVGRKLIDKTEGPNPQGYKRLLDVLCHGPNPRTQSGLSSQSY